VAASLDSQSLKFSELNAAEQQALVEKVHSDLASEAHATLLTFDRAVNAIVDTEIAAEVRRIDTEEGDESGESSDQPASPRATATSSIPAPSRRSPAAATDVGSATKIVAISTSAIISLLEQLPPEHRTLTRMMLGQPFTSHFRARAWALQLRHATAALQYATVASRRRVDTISTMDVQITQRTQTFLEKDFVSATDEKIYTRRRLMVMKTALSYHHTLLLAKGHATTLRTAIYWLVTPIVYVYTGGRKPDPELPPAQEQNFVTELVEAVEALATGPAGVTSLEGGEEWSQKATLIDGDDGFDFGAVPAWALLFRNTLHALSPALLDRCVLVCRNKGLEADTARAIDAEEQAAYLAVAVGSTIERCLADLLSLETTLFVWDQALMSTYSGTIPRIAATVILLLQDTLMACTDRDEFLAGLYGQAKTITVGRLQTALEKFALPEVRKGLGMKTTSMSIAAAQEEQEGGGLEDVGDEVLKQVLKRMEVLSRANEDLDNGLEEKKAGHKVRRLAREKKRPPKWVSPDELMEQLGAEAEKEEKEEKKEKEEKEEKKKMGGKEGKEKKEKKEKKTDEEKEKKKEKKREKARAADFEADVKEAMTRVLGRAYSREEMDSMGPMDRRKYGEKKGALEEALGGLRAKREEEDAGLKEWKGGEGRLDLKEEGGEEQEGKDEALQ